jgi:CRP-like cAMP-binding protein
MNARSLLRRTDPNRRKKHSVHHYDVQPIPLLDAVPRGRRNEVLRAADEVTVPAGTVLVRQGELAHEFFVILEGVADVTQDGRPLTALGPGEFFGEIGLVGPPFRTASVTARSELRLAVVARREFRTLLRRFPELASVVLTAGRVRVVASLREVEARR